MLLKGKKAKGQLGASFVYGDGEIPEWALLGSYDNGTATGKGTSEFIWLPTEDGMAIPVGLYRSGKFYALHTDHLGTPRLMTDSANKPVWQWPYSRFGNNKPTGVLATVTANGVTTTKASKPATELPLRFPGQFADDETGTFYNFLRDSMDPSSGRYRQPDPIGMDGGWSRYPYGDAEPTRKIDPEGLRTFMCTKPLHALGEKWGPRLFPEKPYNPSPFYHQYMCVPNGNRGMSCGGQDRAEGPFGPGKPSTDSFDAGVCKPVDESKCVEQCVMKEIGSSDRPPYALLGGAGGRNNAGAANCQQWADRKLKTCQQQCKAQ